MAHGPHRGAPRRARAAALASLLAIGAVIAIPAAALAWPGTAPAAPMVEPDPQLTPPDPTMEPTVPPTEEPTPPPAPTTPIFVPIEGVRVTATDVELSSAYWTGGGAGTVEISVTNTGNVASQFNGQVTLPGKVQRTGLSGSDGCTATGGSGFSCSLGAGDPPGRVRVQVTVDADAWRSAPLTGSATAAAGGTSDRSTFSVLFPPGPPTPGISLTADNITLPSAPTPRPDTGQLTVRLANTGAVPAAGALEIITPPGVDVVTFPPACTSRKRISADRDRCELGRFDAGREATVTFGVTITAAARADAPLSGAIHGYLTPAGQDTSEVLATYRILVSAGPGESPGASGEPSPGATGEPGIGAGATGEPLRAGNRTLLSSKLSILPIIGAIVGLVSLAGLFVVLSLRRRLQDEVAVTPAPAGDGKIAEKSEVKANVP